MPRRLDQLDIHNLHDTAEAGIMGADLADASVRTLVFRGSTPMLLPASTQGAQVTGLLSNPRHIHMAQAMARQLFAELLPLASLRELQFSGPIWVMTPRHMQLIRQHPPRLEMLKLTLHCWRTDSGPSQQCRHWGFWRLWERRLIVHGSGTASAPSTFCCKCSTCLLLRSMSSPDMTSSLRRRRPAGQI